MPIKLKNTKISICKRLLNKQSCDLDSLEFNDFLKEFNNNNNWWKLENNFTKRMALLFPPVLRLFQQRNNLDQLFGTSLL